MARKKKITVEFFVFGTWVARRVFGSWEELREFLVRHDGLTFDEYRVI